MNVLLDTNVLYAIADINSSRNLTAQTIINMENHGHILYVSTVSIAECVLRYRNDLANLKKLIHLICIHANQFIQGGYLEFNFSEIGTILNAKSEQDIKLILDAWSEKKTCNV